MKLMDGPFHWRETHTKIRLETFGQSEGAPKQEGVKVYEGPIPYRTPDAKLGLMLFLGKILHTVFSKESIHRRVQSSRVDNLVSLAKHVEASPSGCWLTVFP